MFKKKKNDTYTAGLRINGSEPGEPKERSETVNTLRRVCFVVCVCVMLFSGYKLVDYVIENKRAGDAYKDIEQSYVKPPANTAAPTTAPEIIPTAAPEQPDAQPPEETSAEDPPPTVSYIDEPAPDYWPDVDFAGLRGVNQDFAAWLMCPGTNINYPVVQGADNDYYLTHMFTHATNSAGALFIDYRNKSGFADRCTIIYGHHMRNHSMFWTLTRYKNQSFYNAHPTMRLLTEDGNYEIQIFSGFVASTSDKAWRLYFASDEDYLNWIQELRWRSLFTADVPITKDDRIITLSTCDYEFNDARYVLYGKLVPVDPETA